MEVEKTPLPMMTYRTIGGIIDFMIFTGPTPVDVTKQYTHYLGRSYLFPYWSLGFQICRYGYNSLETMTLFFNRDQTTVQDLKNMRFFCTTIFISFESLGM